MSKKNIINITKNAWIKMESIIQSSPNKEGFIFGVTSGGCNGFNFDLKLAEKNEMITLKNKKSTCMQNNNVEIIIDPISEIHLLGTTVDYVKEDYSKGIFENKFVYNIDKKLASSCGCGVSFMPRNIK